MDYKLMLGIFMYLIFISSVIGYVATEYQLSVNQIPINPTVTPVTLTGISWIDAPATSLSYMAVFMNNILAVVLWNVDESIFPMILNIMFIKSALIVLLAMIVGIFLPGG